MFRKFDETVTINKIAKLLFENNFTAMDVNRIYCEVYKCEKLGLEYDLKNLIKETFELKRHSKRSLLNKRLDLNEVAPVQNPLGAASRAQAAAGGQPSHAFPNLGPNAAQKKAAQEAQAAQKVAQEAPAQAPAQQNANNKIIEDIKGQISNLLSVITDPKQLESFRKEIITVIQKFKAPKPAATQQAPAAAAAPAPASNQKAPAPAATQQQQQQQQQQAAK